MKHLKFLTIIMTIPVLAFVFIGCNDDEEPEPQSVLTADAGADQSVTAGDEVTLDGSGSSDSEGLPFDFAWAFESTPEGSSATLSGSTTANPTFTPDVAGEYIIELTISNAESEDSDQVTVTAEENVEPLEIGGTISEDTQLENRFEDPLLPDYIASSNVNIDAVLTIDPGVCIILEEDVLINVSQSSAIIAEGTETDSIKFTSANVAGDLLWKGIYINSASAQNSFSYAIVSYAGNSVMNFSGDDFKAGIGVEDGGNVKVENSKIHDNDGYGLYIDDGGGMINTFANNAFLNNVTGVGVPADEVDDLDTNTSFTDNTSAEVEIFASNLSEAVETTWNPLEDGASYLVSGDIDINGVATISAGAVFELDEDVVITVNGALVANGEDGNMIEFTTSDEAGSLLWKGIYVVSADGRNLLNYVSLSYAGNSVHNFAGDDFAAGVGIESSGRISVTNSSFLNNSGYALYADDGGGQIEDFSDNNFDSNDIGVGLTADEVDVIDGNSTFSNNAQADVEIFSTTYAETKASTWQSLGGGAAYRISGDLDIDGELSIAAGAVFELDEDVLIEVNGSITAEGTSGDPITFTTSNLDGELFWKGIKVNSASSLNSFDFVNLSYAGNSVMNFSGDDYAAGIGVEDAANVSVTNSTFSNNKNFGLYIDDEGGLLENFASNTFSDNQRGVGVPADEVDALDGNSTFSNNTLADVEIFGTNLDAGKEVTWNNLGNAAAYRITGDVDINGDLTIEAGTILEFDEDVQLTINGALIAVGTASDNIVFTTSDEGGTLWQGIFVLSSDGRNELDFTEVSFAGNSVHNFSGADFAANIAVNSGAQLTITNSLISDSGAYGIYSIGSTNDFESGAAGNTFTNNSSGNNYTP